MHTRPLRIRDGDATYDAPERHPTLAAAAGAALPHAPAADSTVFAERTMDALRS